MEQQLVDLIYGALFHDIGKWIMRANNEKKPHAQIGYAYLQKGGWFSAAALDCVRYHHKVDMVSVEATSLAYIVYMADNFAASADRREDTQEVVDAQNMFGFRPSMLLDNVFNVFYDQIPSTETSFKLEALQEGQSILGNLVEKDKTGNTDAKYYKLFQQLHRALEKQQGVSFSLDHMPFLLKLMEATMINIPSSTSTKEIPDISLFNHSKLTAAIATCMYTYFKEKEISDYKKSVLSSKIYEEKMFLLVSVDISGIQEFIYNTSDGGALKMMRGRSFYLELLCEHLVDLLFEQCQVTRVNLLYSGGGHFYCLLPNTAQVKETLSATRVKINNDLLEMFSGTLSVAMSYTEACGDDFRNKKDILKKENLIGKLFGEVSGKISKQKLHKFTQEQLQGLFYPKQKEADGRRECSVCGTSEHLTTYLERELCAYCKGCMILGGHIPFLNERTICITKEKDRSIMPMPSLGEAPLYLTIDADAVILKSMDHRQVKKYYCVNRLEGGLPYATHLWVGNYQMPTEIPDRNVELATLADAANGIRRIGVLRMDVDNLGNAFQKGFVSHHTEAPYQYATLSRSAMLSSSLSLFFKKEMNHIAESMGEDGFSLDFKHKQKRAVTIIYSGGDDVFLVGAWNQVLEFALDLEACFQKFTNGKLTISAGFALLKPNFPIAKMASMAGMLEGIAKKHSEEKSNEEKKPEKNSIALFNDFGEDHTFVFSWAVFRNNVCQEKLYFLNQTIDIQKDTERLFVSMGIIYQLKTLLQTYDKKHRINIARIAYLLSRIDVADDRRKPLYQSFRVKIYNWSLNAKDRQQLLMALNLFIYLNRKDEDVEPRDGN